MVIHQGCDALYLQVRGLCLYRLKIQFLSGMMWHTQTCVAEK
jgi:hypothetical protein